MLIDLSCKEKKVKEQDIHTGANTSREYEAQINLFRDEIVKTIW